MSNFRSFNLDVEEASDVSQVVEAMIEHAVERRTEELEARVQELQEENDGLRADLFEVPAGMENWVKVQENGSIIGYDQADNKWRILRYADCHAFNKDQPPIGPLFAATTPQPRERAIRGEKQR